MHGRQSCPKGSRQVAANRHPQLVMGWTCTSILLPWIQNTYLFYKYKHDRGWLPWIAYGSQDPPGCTNGGSFLVFFWIFIPLCGYDPIWGASFSVASCNTLIRKSEYLWMLVISRLAWIENFFEIMQNPSENHRIPKLVVFRSQNLAIQSRDAPLFGRVQWILGSSTSWCLSLNCWAYPQKRLLWRFGWNYYSNHFSGFLFSGKFWRKNAWSLDFKAYKTYMAYIIYIL